mmetsp:Transcript_7554/g.34215  ORF Transcript_7554/g.34215 Transcript_7554/m.34215 type:complete len:240 (+) Transcript_7554:3181-3900(+)
MSGTVPGVLGIVNTASWRSDRCATSRLWTVSMLEALMLPCSPLTSVSSNSTFATAFTAILEKYSAMSPERARYHCLHFLSRSSMAITSSFASEDNSAVDTSSPRCSRKEQPWKNSAGLVFLRSSSSSRFFSDSASASCSDSSITFARSFSSFSSSWCSTISMTAASTSPSAFSSIRLATSSLTPCALSNSTGSSSSSISISPSSSSSSSSSSTSASSAGSSASSAVSGSLRCFSGTSST